MTTTATSAPAAEGATTTAAPAAAAATTGTSEAGKTAEGTTTTATGTLVSGAQPTNTEGKAAGATTDSAKAKEGAAEELQLKFPDGVAPDETLLSKVKPVLQELGLKSEGAQKLVDAWVTGQSEAVQKLVEKQNKEWVAQAKADADIGGDKFEKTVAAVQRVFKEFGTPALAKLYEETGLGNHPEMLRVWAKVAKAVGNDRVAGTTEAGASPAKSGDAAFAASIYTHPTSQKYAKE